MTMMGGVELIADTPAEVPKADDGPKVKVAVIGLGAWGREIVKALGTLPKAELMAICDTYAPIMRRAAATAPDPAPNPHLQAILPNKGNTPVRSANPNH